MHDGMKNVQKFFPKLLAITIIVVVIIIIINIMAERIRLCHQQFFPALDEPDCTLL